MSWPKRLPEEAYAAAIDEAEAHLRKYIPKDASMTWTMSRFRFWRTMLSEAETQKASAKPMSQLEVREKYYRELLARAEAGDQPADTHLRMLAIDYLGDAIEGRNGVVESDALLLYMRNQLEVSLPRDEDYLRGLRRQIAHAVENVLAKLPDVRPTRNHASRTPRHPESACSLVAKALARVGRAMSENNVQKAWEAYGAFRDYVCSKNSH